MASSAVITDMTTCVNNLSTTQQARAVAAAGPIMDLTAMCNQIILKFQECVQILNYLLYGDIAGSAGGAYTLGGTSALLRSGDSNQANTYAKANAVLTTLS